jgi:hypothetical protein
MHVAILQLSLLPAVAGFLLCIHFNPEDGGYIFLRNVGGLIPNCKVLQPRRWYLSIAVYYATKCGQMKHPIVYLLWATWAGQNNLWRPCHLLPEITVPHPA